MNRSTPGSGPISGSVSRGLSRRSVVSLGGSVLSVGVVHSVLGSEPGLTQPPRTLKPDKAPAAPTATRDAGKPVSLTAAAQEGGPVIPGPPARKVRFALVGLGKLMIDEILPALKLTPRCEITALVTGNPEKGKAFADMLGLGRDRVFGYEDIARFDRDETIDAVYIATPNSVHARDTVAALRAGKHVLCEKPIAATLEQADAMVAAAAETGRKLMIAYRVHHEPLNLAIKEMLKERIYGKPNFVIFDALLDVGKKPQPRLSKELSGGGSLFDIGIYALNTTCWLLGESPTQVNAMQVEHAGDARFDEVEGSIAFQLRFASGCVATCTSSYGSASVNRYRIVCEKGWMGMNPATHYRGIKGEHGDASGQTTLGKPETVNQFAAEFEHFAECIQEDRPVDSPGEEGRRDLALMLKIYEAARTGRTISTSDL